MTATPTGRHQTRDGQDVIAFTRTFRAPVEDVWAAVTESDRLERWIGRWTGDPSSGEVTFLMTAEGEDVPESRYEILACEPPRLLRVTTTDDFGTWDLSVELVHDDGVTELTFSQVVTDPGMLESTGPGWDYYLDRLVAAETGGDLASIDFDRDYFPAQKAHYVAIAKKLTRP